MILLIVTVTVEPAHAAEFEKVLGVLAASSLANEPGTLTYKLARSEDDPRCYRIVEIYQDQAALDAHMASEWLKTAGQAIGGLTSGQADVQKHTIV